MSSQPTAARTSSAYIIPSFGMPIEVSKLAREASFDYLLVESTGILEPLLLAEPRLGRRTVLTFPLLPPPQKN